ncbi:MAG: DNA repair protein RadA [Oscillospiraceae bacterium]|nr:DNA repair protein RadA [Oscillospiraceae bacterium]
MAKKKSVFFCTECGGETLKWAGRCPACGAWNTVVEQEIPAASRSTRSAGGGNRGLRSVKAVSLSEIDTAEEVRFLTGMGELDRVLGGGAVKGSLVLVGGAPGVGKSTLMLQICGSLCRANLVLYVSGEESVRQLKLRSQRLGVASGNLLVLSDTGLEDILQSVSEEEPDILIVDSIQTMYNGALDSPPGSITQVKDCTMALMQLAKGHDITVFVIGHVNKEGSIAGPKVLEHMVDCVLYFEGEQHSTCRILRAAKNRFGATNEIGVFEMLDNGLAEVENPSQMLLSGRPEGAPGTCVTCVMEGMRPVLAEIQALLAPAPYGSARRSSNGFDYNRASMLLAVLEKRGGLKVSACDAYLNIIGGLTLDEPAADLAAVLAMASSYLDRPIPAELAAIGEVGLTGELRVVNNLDQRLSEVRRLGFRRCVIPRRKGKPGARPEGLQVLEAANIGEAMRAIFGK